MVAVVPCESSDPTVMIYDEYCILIRSDSDVHVYYMQANASQKQFAKELWERIRRECKWLLLTIYLLK